MKTPRLFGFIIIGLFLAQTTYALIPCNNIGLMASCYDFEPSFTTTDTSGNNYGALSFTLVNTNSTGGIVGNGFAYSTTNTFKATLATNATAVTKFRDSAFVIATWFWGNSSTSNDKILVHDKTSGSGADYYLQTDGSGNANFAVQTDCSIVGTTNIKDGYWHRIVITRPAVLSGTSNTTYLYVDGQLQSTAGCTNTMGGDVGTTYIGGDGAVSHQAAYPMRLDQVLFINGTTWNDSTVSHDYYDNYLYLNFYDETSTARLNTVGAILNSPNTSTTYTGSNGQLIIQNISDGSYNITLSGNSSYANRQLSITPNSITNRNYSIYLAMTTNTVTMQVIDSIMTSTTLQGAVGSMYRTINNTNTLLDTRIADITGNVQFSYLSNIPYTFIFTYPGYNNKTFSLDPIIYTSYTIRMIRPTTINFSQDYQGVLITYNPKIFYANLTNNFTISFDSIDNSFTNYSYNLSYPGGSKAGNGTTSSGQTFVTAFNITGGDVYSKVNLTYTYTNSYGTKTFFLPHGIIYGPNNGTIVAGAGEQYGLGIVERVIIGTLIIVIFVGLTTLAAGPIGGLAATLFLMGFLIKIGFWEWWLGGLSLIVGFVIIARRTE